MSFDLDEDYIVHCVAYDEYGYGFDEETAAQTRAFLRNLKVDAWEEAYWQGIEDERTTRETGHEPKRINPYRTVKGN